MANIPMALLSEKDFEIARELIPELSDYQNYDDWLDYRYGHFMGCSLGGLDVEWIIVALEDFLDWCRKNQISPSERALDEFCRHVKGQSDQVCLAA